MHRLHADLDIAGGQAPRYPLSLYDSDELLDLGRIVTQWFAWPIKNNPPAIQDNGAWRNVERKT